jgi:phospholipid/cholesterol/gamma-HCH transport system ATP-binding protein
MNVVENIAFPLLERYRMPDAEIMERVRDLLRRLDLANVSGIEQKFPAELSGGQRKRVGLARALIDRPEILLYDEPTTGLDPLTAHAINLMIRSLQRTLQVTSIVVTHDIASAYQVGDRIAFLDEGQMAFVGSVDEARHSRDARLRSFLTGGGEQELA